MQSALHGDASVIHMAICIVQAQGRQRPQRILREPWVCNATCSIAVTKWITKRWAKYTKGLHKLVLGVVFMNSIVSLLRFSQFAPHNIRCDMNCTSQHELMHARVQNAKLGPSYMHDFNAY